MLRESIVNLDRWLALMALWSFDQNEATYRSIMESYSEKGRHYHSLEHVAACLRNLDQCVDQVAQPREVEIALWFHDAVYKPLSSDNERKCANWASSFLRKNGATSDQIARVDRLIMVTEHGTAIETKDESILVDIDLSILGAKPEVYDAFERGVREEYKMIPRFIYNKKRAELLRGFLERPQIFQNKPFSTERERQAKQNLLNAISKLTGNA